MHTDSTKHFDAHLLKGLESACQGKLVKKYISNGKSIFLPLLSSFGGTLEW